MSSTANNLQSKQGLLGRLTEARTPTDGLFSVVHPDALHDRPIPERHRIVFSMHATALLPQMVSAPPLPVCLGCVPLREHLTSSSAGLQGVP